MLLKWWRTSLTPNSTRRIRSRRRENDRPGARFTPRLERLEDRSLLKAGDLDPGFGSSGAVLTSLLGSLDNVAQATASQTDGKIVAVGTVTTSATGSDFALVRYNTDGSLDTTFGTGGRVNTDFAGGADKAFGIALQTDAKIVVVGGAGTSSGTDFALARYNPDGSLDLTFGTGGKVTTDFGSNGDRAAAVAIQIDGNLVVVGTNNAQDFAAARYDTSGNLDNSFGTGGRVLTDIATSSDSATSLVIQTDGGIVVAGTATSGAAQRFALVRYTTTGSLDTTFGAGTGIVSTVISATPSSAAGVALQFGSTIVVAGTVGNFGSRDFAVAEYDSFGNLNPSFGIGGTVITDLGNSDDVVSGLLVQPDGRIVVAGSSGVPGRQDFAVVRYTSFGSLDTTFNGTGIAITDLAGHDDQANALVRESDGSLVLVGSASSHTQDFALVRYDSAGNLNVSLDGDGKVTTDFQGSANAASAGTAVQSDGKIVTAGSVGGQFALVRYNVDGRVDTTFGTSGQVVTSFGQPASAAGVVLQTDGKIVVAGSCTVDGTSRFALARYNGDGSLDSAFGSAGTLTTNFGPNTALANEAALQADGKIVVVGTSSPGAGSFALARYNTDGSLDASFGAGGQVTRDFGVGNDDVANGVAIQADGRIVVVGSSLNVSLSDQDFALARFNADGSLDGTFGTGGQVTTNVGSREAAAAVVVQADGKMVVVGSTGIFGNLNFAVLRYDANGNLDATFGSGGTVTTDFGSQQEGATGVVLQSDGKIVAAGSSGAVGANVNFVLARYTTTGSLDSAFGTGGLVQTDFLGLADDAFGIALQANGRFLVAGSATSGATRVFALARYLGDQLIVLDLAATTAAAFEAGLVPGVLTLTRSGDTTTAVTIRYAVAGTAVPGTDYTALDGVVVLAAGVTTGTISVTPLDSAFGTCNDTIVVSLTADPAYTLGASVSGTVTLVRNPLKIFVVALYRDVLERLPDIPGQSFWVGQLTKGVARSDVALAFWLSPEHRGIVVDQLYATLLHRQADAGGRGGWVNFLVAGGSESDVAIGFLTSPEYTAAHATNASFVQGLYSDVLLRKGSEDEIAFWERVLQTGLRTRTALVVYFLSSQEAFLEALDEYYGEFLGRDPDPFGQQAFLAEILAERTTSRLLIAAFLGSEEYFARVQLMACS